MVMSVWSQVLLFSEGGPPTEKDIGLQSFSICNVNIKSHTRDGSDANTPVQLKQNVGLCVVGCCELRSEMHRQRSSLLGLCILEDN